MNGRRWTADEDAALRCGWSPELTLHRLAIKLNRPANGVYLRAARLGLPLGCPQGAEYLTHAARRLGFHVAQLRAICRWGAVPIRPAFARPTDCRRSRYIVDSYEAESAVERWLQAEPVHALAARGALPCSRRTLLRRLRAIGITAPHHRQLRVTPEQVQQALALRTVNHRLQPPATAPGATL